jgi:hypothetical protein
MTEGERAAQAQSSTCVQTSLLELATLFTGLDATALSGRLGTSR